jgi:hypothetical protein
MSDNYGDIRSEAKLMVERMVELELEHQAVLAMNRDLAENGDMSDAYDWTDEQKALKLALYSDEWRGEVASWFADITELFEDLADLPDPDPLRDQASSLNGALTLMAGPSGHTDVGEGAEYGPSAAFEKLSSIPTLLADWEGDAAVAFKLNFIPPLERVAHHEFEAIVALRSPLLAAAALWEEGRKDVSNLIDECNSALDDFEDGKDAADLTLALGIIGAVVAVAAVPFTGGTSAAVYWAVAGAAISVTGSVVGHPVEPKKELDISGDSPAEIAQSLREAVGDMKLQWLEVEMFIRDQITTLSDQISGYSPSQEAPTGPYYGPTKTYDVKTTYEFALPRPSLADATPQNVTHDDYLGKPK